MRMMIIAAAAFAAATPALAQSAAPLSLAPIGATLDQPSGLAGDSYFLPALVIFGVLAAAILISHDDNGPASP